MSQVISTMSVKLDLDATKFESGLQSLGTKINEVGDRMRNIGSTLTTRVSAPIVAGFGFAVMAASDLNETLNKTNVVFGDAADGVIAWSEDSATAFGLSQNAALGAASTFGNIFTSMGMAGDAAAALSQDVVGLGADLGSFNNVPTAEALDAIRAGLLGEYEPLRRFGIVLDAAAVEAKALEMNLGKTSDQLTEQDLLLARQALITEGAANAQGDFAETSGSLANQLKTLRARLENAAAAIGQVLLPYVTRLVGFISGLVERFGNLSNRMRVIIVIFGAVAAGIGPVLLAIGTMLPIITKVIGVGGKLIKLFKALRIAMMGSLGPILLIVAALALLYFVWSRDLFGIRTKVTKWFDTFKQSETFARITETVKRLKAAVIDFAGRALAKAVEWFRRLIDAIRGPAASAFAAFKAILATVIDFVAMVIGGIISRLDPLKSAFFGIVAMISGFVGIFKNLFEGDIRGAFDSFVSMLEGYFQYLSGLGEFLFSVMSGVLAYLWTALSSVDWVGLGTTLLGYLKTAIGYVVGLSGELASKALDMVSGFVAWLQGYDWESLGATLLGYLNSVIAAVVDLGGKLAPKALEMVSGFAGYLSTYNWAELGTTLLGYIIVALDAVIDLGVKLGEKASEMIGGFVDWIAAYDWAGFGSTLLGYIVDAVTLYVTLYSKLVQAATDLVAGFVDWIKDYDWAGFGSNLLGYVVDAITLYVKLYSKLVQAATDLVAGFVDWIKDYDWAGMAKDILGYVVDAVTLYVKLYSKLVQAATDLVTGFVDYIRDYDWAGLGSKILGYIGDAVTAIGDVGDVLWDVGYDLIWGLGEGIKNNAEKFVGAAIDWAIGLVPGWARDILESFSPSRVFMDIGKDVVAGLAIGIEDNVGVVRDAVDELAGTVADTEIAAPKFANIADAWTAAGGAVVGGRMIGAASMAMAANGSGVSVTINVNGATDPTATADAVYRALNRELGLRGAI